MLYTDFFYMKKSNINIVNLKHSDKPNVIRLYIIPAYLFFNRTKPTDRNIINEGTEHTKSPNTVYDSTCTVITAIDSETKIQ